MRIWPVIFDSRPSYLDGRGRSGSLLLAPLGTKTLIEHLATAVEAVTVNAPLIVAGVNAGPRYPDWIRALCPTAEVIGNPQEFAGALDSHEPSDALLFVDPRCMPLHGFHFSELLRHHTAEPRVSHHLVAFERAIAGTKERVCFDARGQIRGIQRYYEQTTWPFIAGITASLVPSACLVVADAVIPPSLPELRQLLIGRGVPARDVPIDGRAVDLADEHGMLAANERFILKATADQPTSGSISLPIYVGQRHMVHQTARLIGPVIVHPDVCIEAGAAVLGPAVIGQGARIGAGAVVAHATVGPDCYVPPDSVVRDRTWFQSSRESGLVGTERPPLPYNERLARLSIDVEEGAPIERGQAKNHQTYLSLKRALDAFGAGVGLMIILPLLIIIAIAIWLESRGPIFYGDNRESLGGRVFKCWKFRTMYTGAHLAQRELKALNHTDGPHFKIDRDPRVTTVGRILRSLNFDEIPQLFNVLVGDMSLVGPRPSPFRENQVCVPWRDARLSVRPGITGFWQVCRHNRSAGDFHQWIEFDLLYVQHQSLWLDAKILAATVITLGGKVAHVKASWLVDQNATVDDTVVIEPAEPQRQQVA